MRKGLQRKSEVLREGYVKGLRRAQRVISEMIEEGAPEGGCVDVYQLVKAVKEHVYRDRSFKSAWRHGVDEYAIELVGNLSVNYGGEQVCDRERLHEMLLNGARNWGQFSYGGCSLAYDKDIAKRLCNPSELRRNRDGRRHPNPRESWLDVQRRALFQAEMIITRVFDELRGAAK